MTNICMQCFYKLTIDKSEVQIHYSMEQKPCFKCKKKTQYSIEGEK